MFFSHVIKGQPENMKLLHDLLDQKVQLIDYEKIAVPVDGGNKEQRLVAFGKYAGLAGMIDTLSIVGQRLLRSHSLSTPFLNCPPSIYHQSLDDAKCAVRRVGERIAVDGITIPSLVKNNNGPYNYTDEDGLSPNYEPLVFCLTGGPRGNVYSGVREIFDLLPHEVVAVEDLPALYDEVAKDSSSASQNKVYCVVPEMKDLYSHIGGGGGNDSTSLDFDRSHFVKHPAMYRSTFAEKVAPYTNVLVNSIYWEHRYPRLLTKDDMFQLYDTFGNER
jgi:alpha-aminoadipic semialdehyde synthase